MKNNYLKIQSYIEKNFDNFKKLVCEELINYFGEEYRQIILSRINETNFTFYINPKYNELLRFKYKKKDNYKLLKKIYNIIQKEIKKNKLGNGEIYNSGNSISPMFLSIVSDNSICFTYMYNNSDNELKRDIFIPLFYATDESIIHEMIHSIMSSPLFLSIGKYGDTLKYKFGIGFSSSTPEGLFEECMTEIDARIIAQRLKDNNISFIDSYYLFDETKSFYDNFIPFVSELYESFKEEIIYSRITLNNRRFIYGVGKENYMEFISLFNDYYENMYDCEKSDFKYLFDRIIEKMNECKNGNQLILRK